MYKFDSIQADQLKNFNMKKLVALCVTCLFVFVSYSQQNNIVPAPQKVVYNTGAFVFSNCTKIDFNSKDTLLFKAIRPLINKMHMAVGIDLLSDTKCKSGNAITIALDKSITNAEGYRLLVKPNNIEIKAQQPAGVFYAIQT